MIEFASDLTIEKALLQGYYHVPRFQRPYSWTGDNVAEFWQDVTEERADNYFIGAFIVYEHHDGESGRSSPEYAIVDGQQRITTITLLLAAVRDAFQAAGEDSLAQGVQSYISRPDRRNRIRFLLEAEGGYPYLQARIQSFPPEEAHEVGTRPDEKRLKQAYDYFSIQLAELRSSILDDPRYPSGAGQEKVVQALEDIRDRLLNLTVILVIVSDIDDAYVIFETLNTRGKDLSLADLVRNFFLRDLREAGDSADFPRDRFNAILERLHDPDIDVDSSDFLHHSWLSRRSYTSKVKLFSAMKEAVHTRSDKERLLREYEADTQPYIQIRRPHQRPWPRQQWPLQRSLGVLETFHILQPMPLALSTLRAYQERRLRLRAARRILRAIEVFHFAHTVIAGQSSSGGLSRRYASFAARISHAESSSVQRHVDDFIEAQRASMPSKDEFLAGFTALRFGSNFTRDKAKIQYALSGLYEHNAPGQPIDFSRMTIEHIAPQRPKSAEHAMGEEHVTSVGNLILVPERLNQDLANRSFPEKVELLRAQSDVWVDESVLNAERWTSDLVEARARQLAETAWARVWIVD